MTTLDQDAMLAAIVANPDEDTPRLMMADALEEYDPNRAEFIRVQCEFARLQVGRAEYDDGTMWEREGELAARYAALLAAQRIWLAVGACERCGGTGNGALISSEGHGRHGKSTFAKCRQCYEGDTGGLLRAGVEVAWRRGWPHRVTVPEIGWLVEEEVFATVTAREMGAREQITRTVPSKWLRSVLTAVPERGLIAEVVPKCRVPWNSGVGHVAWAHNDRTEMPDQACCLPGRLWDALEGHSEKQLGIYKRYLTADLALAALGRTFVKWGRS